MSTSTEVVLDTNFCIAVLNSGRGPAERLPATARPLVPVIVFGELFYGAYRSKHINQNLERIAELTKVVRIVFPDWQTASAFGKVRHQLITTGNRIPDDDMWIAAIALQHDAPLVTRDKHFEAVQGLTIIRW